MCASQKLCFREQRLPDLKKLHFAIHLSKKGRPEGGRKGENELKERKANVSLHARLKSDFGRFQVGKGNRLQKQRIM